MNRDKITGDYYFTVKYTNLKDKEQVDNILRSLPEISNFKRSMNPETYTPIYFFSVKSGIYTLNYAADSEILDEIYINYLNKFPVVI